MLNRSVRKIFTVANITATILIGIATEKWGEDMQLELFCTLAHSRCRLGPMHMDSSTR